MLSSLLFNAALEMAFARWSCKLDSHGWCIDSGAENLTNTRYADDVLLYAKYLEELKEMLKLLLDEFRKVGLEMHESKAKILTSRNTSQEKFTVRNMSRQILPVSSSHKYLGKLLCLDPSTRADVAFNHRLGVAWATFNSLRR